ncbi:MAG TPA: tetratricopeptide repeat protein [Micropepsaceae bacterium]|nr:tetratricopeptide repeat protein [Micropepsaceae bacterium]
MSHSLLRTAASLHRAGNLSEAVHLYQQILHTQPPDFEVLYALGMAHLQSGRLEEALENIKRALKLKFDFPDGWCIHGRLLMRLNRPEEALRSFNSALSLKPDFTDALASRASALAQLNRPAEALVTFNQLLALRPGDADGWNNRGGVLVSLLRLEDALESFDRALALQPDFVEALSNRAAMLRELNRLDEALAACDATLRLKPDHAVSWNNRGNTLVALARYEEAVASYDKALALDRSLTPAADNRDLALLELKRVKRCPPGYLRNLFDEFSSDYDETMLETLGYRAHLHLRALADRVLPRFPAGRRILDLGSGTGLVGEVFKDLAAGGRLDGVDLSPRMIEAAQQRAIYDDLILGDIETVLAAFERSYDLILAADTMIYFGDLEPTLTNVFKRLIPGGFYIFAIERKDCHGWEQTDTRRFRHSEAYLRNAAAHAGLAFAASIPCVLRRQQNEPVPGLAVALQKPLP